MIKDNWNALGKAAEGTNGDSDSATRDTAIYQTLLTCLRGKFKMNLHSNTSHSNILSIEHSDMSLQSLFQPVSPAEALMADSESDILVSRFRPEQRARVATDLQREDDLLRDYIETGKLDFWVPDSAPTRYSRGQCWGPGFFALAGFQGAIDVRLSQCGFFFFPLDSWRC
jgi:nuclear pore complex protein Nup133